MAVKIYHGPAGSYKTSSAVWFELLPALRAGRAVVTNVEGMYPLRYIEKALGEKFPASTRLYRVSSQSDKSRRLWRSWYHWMPIGAFVLIDEIQDIYPKTGWTPKELDLKPVDYYSDVFKKTDIIDYFKDVRSSFAPVIDESSTDDLGDSLFADDGLIQYPLTFNESYKRHRKYNWDVVLCTPDITEVHRFIRGVAEIALSLSSKDSIFFSSRKPRTFEHNPKRDPLPTKKDMIYRRKVPRRVHDIYKSTQTGQTTKSGAAASPLSTFKVKAMLALFLLCSSYFCYSLYSRFASDTSASSSSPVVASVPLSGASTVQSDPVSASADIDPLSASRPANRVFLMPFNATDISLSGVSCRRLKPSRVKINTDCQSVFQASIAGKQYFIQGMDLIDMGYRIVVYSDCRADIYDHYGQSRSVYCAPSPVQADEVISNPVKLQPSFVSSVTVDDGSAKS